MKHLYGFFIVVFFVCSQFLSAQETVNPDSIHISLLTCSPHQEVYSLYGHTAIRLENHQTGTDVAVNYGMFDFHKSFFVLRFVFGLTDYEMGIFAFPEFLQEYQSYGSEVLQQEINLTPQEKLKVVKALEENYRPENRVYRYNYFYDNCTTRARDIIIDNINGTVRYTTQVPKELTYRDMIHQMNEGHPWARLGNDLLLGAGADRPLTEQQTQFLPRWMAEAAEKAVIVGRDGHERPLVLRQTVILEGQSQTVEKEFPLTPLQCAFTVLILVLSLSIIEWKTKCYIWWLDVLLFVCQSLCSIIIVAMVFSQHPTVSINTQILLFNPIAMIFGYTAVRCFCQHRVHWLWLVEIILICLMLIFHYTGIQWIDPSVRILAIVLLLRSALKLHSAKR